MVDQNLTQLTATTELDDGDLAYVVRDPSGTAVDRKVTIGDLRATVAAAAPLFFGADVYALLPGVTIARNGHANTGSGDIQALPFRFDRDSIRITALAFNVSTAQADQNAQMAVYRVSSAGSGVGAPLWTSSSIPVDTTGVKAVTGLTIDLDPGTYVACFHTTAGNVQVSTYYSTGPTPIGASDMRTIDQIRNGSASFGTWPSDLELSRSGTNGLGQGPRVMLFARWEVLA